MLKLLYRYLESDIAATAMNQLKNIGYTIIPADSGDICAIHKRIDFMEYYASSIESRELIITRFKTFEPTKEQKYYLRLRLLPKDGLSFNYLTQTKEIGVSVFEIKDYAPVLDNLQLIDSFATRDRSPAFIVTGDEVGTGHDGEPLITNARYVCKVDIDFVDETLYALDQAYSVCLGEYCPSMYSFTTSETGDSVSYCGYLYCSPVDGFNIRIGANRNK